MPDLRAIVSMPYLSGKPEDIAVNVLHFASASGGEGAADVIRGHVETLFNVAPPNGPSGNQLSAISGYLSRSLSRAVDACTVKVYDLGTPEPRIPILRKWTLGAPIGVDDKELPAEVALAVSIYAGVNQPRHRGRIYFGPFSLAATEDDLATQRSRPALLLREAAGGAVKRLINAGANTQNLAVYSRGQYTVNKIPQPKVPGVMRIATAGWVDDAWDTQRRRGQGATVRYPF